MVACKSWYKSWLVHNMRDSYIKDSASEREQIVTCMSCNQEPFYSCFPLFIRLYTIKCSGYNAKEI